MAQVLLLLQNCVVVYETCNAGALYIVKSSQMVVVIGQWVRRSVKMWCRSYRAAFLEMRARTAVAIASHSLSASRDEEALLERNELNGQEMYR